MAKRGFSGETRPTVTTSVRIDWELHSRAKKRGINISDLMNRSLRALLKAQDPSYARVEEALEQQAADVAAQVGNEIEVDRMAVEAVLIELQPLWNIFVGGAPEKDRSARVAWVTGKQSRYPELRGVHPDAIIKELGG